MAHTYAHLGQWLDFQSDGGSTTLLTGTTPADIAQRAALLKVLESASRTVDAFCGRSRFGSGFGPRTASNRYDSNGSYCLDLGDDFLTISTVTALAGTGGASTSLVEDTDFYPRPYARSQKRELQLNQLTSGQFYAGWRTVTVNGTAGYSNDTVTATATAGTIGSTSATTFTVGGTDDLFVGMTLLIDSERLYLRAKNGTTATVVRGREGSTAATHSNAAPIAYYVYPDEVTHVTLLIAQRRQKMRQAGVTGEFGGASIPGATQRDSEWSLLRSTVGHLRIFGVG